MPGDRVFPTGMSRTGHCRQMDNGMMIRYYYRHARGTSAAEDFLIFTDYLPLLIGDFRHLADRHAAQTILRSSPPRLNAHAATRAAGDAPRDGSAARPLAMSPPPPSRLDYCVLTASRDARVDCA